MSKVAILLSTYNGNEYVKEQIESIYRQTFSDFTLYVRDDGSSEEFVSLLREMQIQYGFELEEGHNLGFVKSFMTLLEQVKDAKYYAFADQDDIWLENKLKRAVEWFECEAEIYAAGQDAQIQKKDEGYCREEIPILYHSAYDVIDSEGKVINHFYFPNDGYDFRRSITENHYSGFAMMINGRMRDMILSGNPEQIGYHDWWAAMIAQGLGAGYSDSCVMALHRAHGDNVTTFNLKTRIQWLKQSLTEEQELHKRAVEFDRCFGQQLTEEKKNILNLFCFQQYHFGKAIRKSLYPKRWRPVISSEVVMRLLMLLGRI